MFYLSIWSTLFLRMAFGEGDLDFINLQSFCNCYNNHLGSDLIYYLYISFRSVFYSSCSKSYILLFNFYSLTCHLNDYSLIATFYFINLLRMVYFTHYFQMFLTNFFCCNIFVHICTLSSYFCCISMIFN